MPKLPISSMAQFVTRNPFTTAAAVFTPLFAKNEDRGYFRTALITTPIVFATGQFAPRLFAGTKDLIRTGLEQRNLLSKAEKWTRFEQPNFNDLSTLFKDPAASQDTIERALSSYLVTEKRSRDFLKEQKVLDRYFKRRFAKTSDLISKATGGDLEAAARIGEIEQLWATKGRLISNAMHVSRRSSLTPLEWSQEASGVMSTMNSEEALAMYEQFRNREPFVRTLKNRLREVNRLEYNGRAEFASAVPGPMSVMNIPMLDEADFATFGKRVNPSMFENLATAKRAGRIQEVTLIAERVTSGETGRILSVQVERKGNLKPLSIPVVDPATGQVRLGSTYDSVGVGNYVIGPDRQAYRIDEWISKQLAENPALTNEQLNEEISAHAYWMSGDPLDAHRMGELKSMGGEGVSAMHEQAIKLRSYGAGITKLPIFEGNRDYYQGFTAGEKVDFIRGIMNTDRFINMGSEAGVYEGRWQLRDVANLNIFGAPSAEKQDYIWRSVTKEFRLNAPEGMPDAGRLNVVSDAWAKLTGSSNMPAAKFTVAGISPQDRTLFTELPKTLDELHFSRNEVVQKFINRGMSPGEATGMFGDLERLYSEGKQGALSYLGGMGETGFVGDPNFTNNFTVEGISKYNMDELAVKSGDIVDPTVVMGFNQGERVLPNFTGKVVDIGQADGRFTVNVRHELSMQGAKLDVGGVKGMLRVTGTNEHFTQLKDLMNNYYSRMGSGDKIGVDVNVLAPMEYFTNKVEPMLASAGIASDVVSRLESSGAGDVAAGYKAAMATEGISFSGGQMIVSGGQLLKDREAADRLLRLNAINEEFFAKAGEAIRTAGGYQDPVLSAFVHSGQDLGNFMLKNSLPAMGFTWDHSLVNAPRFATITHDIETYMGLGGHYRGLKALRSRLKTVSGGDPEQSRDFLSYVMGGDFSKPMGTTVPLNQAFSSPGGLNLASNRAGSIFDPSVEAYQQNFRVDLGNGRFLPVPGTAAYGAEAPQYAPGEYQTRDWQHTLQDMAYAKTPEEKSSLEQKLMREYQEQFGTGKGSALRPYQYDPMGVPGFLSTTAAEGGDPFIARVSQQWVDRLHSKRLRKALSEGEDVIGMLHRQPTNELLYLKYRLDPALEGTMDVAVPESVSRMYMGDQDKDLVNSILFDANTRMEKNKMIVAGAANEMERQAAEEGIEAMQGLQQRQMAIWQSLKGDQEISTNVTAELRGLSAGAEKFAAGVASRATVAANRTAGAAIGAYSNTLTEMVEQMVRNPKMMRDPELVQRLKTGLFDIRQAPISARKAHVTFNLETAMQKVDLLNKAIANQNPDIAASRAHEVLLGMAATLSPEKMEGPEYKYWATQGAEDLKAWALGRSEKARLFKAAMTARGAGGVRTLGAITEATGGIEGVLGPLHGGRMAEETASKIGIVSEYLADLGRDTARGATGKVGAVFQKHGKAMAIGLGTLAALGVALTPSQAPVATFSRRSGGKYRPEEVMGVNDNVPGEPMEGAMAPSNPPRRMEARSAGVRTSVVAPMSATSDLTVHMRATDRGRAAETARLLSQIPGSGDTNVTINYRDRTRLRSLRTREKIRDLR